MRTSNISIRQIEYFVDVVETGSCTKTAENAHVTPQTVSKAINKLERKLGVALLEKSGRGIVPTTQARELFESARELLTNDEKIEQLADRLSQEALDEGIVTLAMLTTPYRGTPLDKSLFAQFEANHPDIALDIEAYSGETCIDAVQGGLADAAITIVEPSSLPNGFKYERIANVQTLAVMSKSHPLSQLDSIPLDKLAAFPIATPNDLRYAYSGLRTALECRGLHATFKNVEPTSSAFLSFFAENGLVLAFKNTPLPARFNNLTAIPLTPEDDLAWPVLLIYQKSHHPSPLPLLVTYLRNLPEET